MPYNTATFDSSDLLPARHMDQSIRTFLFQIDGQRNGPQQRCRDVADRAPGSDGSVKLTEQFQARGVIPVKPDTAAGSNQPLRIGVALSEHLPQRHRQRENLEGQSGAAEGWASTLDYARRN